jgi:hypothetical protein
MLHAIALTAALIAPAPTSASPYALIGPSAAQRPLDAAARQRVIAQAEAAVGRPPRARADLHTEGTLPGKGIREASLYAKEDQPAVLALGLAWRATHDPRYLAAAERYLTAWATTYKPSFNPIDETGFDALILAQDLTRADLSAPSRVVLDRFWRGMAAGYLDTMDKTPRNAETNWQSHRVKLATMAAFASGDPALIDRARAAYRRQVAANIHPDGSVFDFYERDALHYVTYDLDPLLMAALAARAHGEDWYSWRSPAGASLAAAVRWLQPYALGEKTHIEFVHSRIQFDRDRAAAAQAEYAPHPWDRRNAVQTFALAAVCDPALGTVSARIAEATHGNAPPWLTLLR